MITLNKVAGNLAIVNVISTGATGVYRNYAVALKVGKDRWYLTGCRQGYRAGRPMVGPTDILPPSHMDIGDSVIDALEKNSAITVDIRGIEKNGRPYKGHQFLKDLWHSMSEGAVIVDAVNATLASADNASQPVETKAKVKGQAKVKGKAKVKGQAKVKGKAKAQSQVNPAEYVLTRTFTKGGKKRTINHKNVYSALVQLGHGEAWKNLTGGAWNKKDTIAGLELLADDLGVELVDLCVNVMDQIADWIKEGVSKGDETKASAKGKAKAKTKAKAKGSWHHGVNLVKITADVIDPMYHDMLASMQGLEDRAIKAESKAEFQKNMIRFFAS